MSAEDAGPTGDVGPQSRPPMKMSASRSDADEDVGPNASPAEGDDPLSQAPTKRMTLVYSPDELLPAAEPVAQFEGKAATSLVRGSVIDDVGDGARTSSSSQVGMMVAMRSVYPAFSSLTQPNHGSGCHSQASRRVINSGAASQSSKT